VDAPERKPLPDCALCIRDKGNSRGSQLSNCPKEEYTEMATATDQQLDQLKQKYQQVFQVIQQEEVRLTHIHIVDNKLFIQGDASSEQAKNKVWDAIKSANPNWQSELTADIRVTGGGQQGASQAQPQPSAQRTYTVKSGDTLSKIAKEMYGSASEYMKIFEGNRDKLDNPDKIQPGQELKIPS
jgi:nucleoid-associated protein YgaU